MNSTLTISPPFLNSTANVTISRPSENKASTDPDDCRSRLTQLDAFLYGFPGGLLFAGLLLLCFITFGHAITARKVRNPLVSVSSITNQDTRAKKKKRGPPPSSELRHVDVDSMALQADAPDDIREIAVAKKKNTKN